MTEFCVTHLAKSAIRSGIKILCERGGIEPAGVQNVFVAGGLGFYINKHNAVSAGVFPKEFLGLISVRGNVSLKGAEASLRDGRFLQRCRQIIERCSVIDLARAPSFTDEFAENMLFDGPA